MKYGFLTLSFASLLFVGCGGQDAIDATKSMPGYLQNMTNVTNGMANVTSDMKKQGDITAEDLRLQKLDTGIQRMTDPANTLYLSPAPFDMFAGAQIAADAITPDELIKLAFVELVGVDKQTPDDSLKVVDPKTGKLDFPDSLKASVDHDKFVKVTEIELLAAFASEDVINQIISTQITNHGAYEPWAYPLLMARVLALRSYLIEESILNNPLINVEQLDLAVTRTEYLKHIAQLPFVAQIHLTTIGMLNLDDNINEVMDPNMMTDLKSKLLRIGNTQLNSDAVNSADYGPVMARINAL